MFVALTIATYTALLLSLLGSLLHYVPSLRSYDAVFTTGQGRAKVMDFRSSGSSCEMGT